MKILIILNNLCYSSFKDNNLDLQRYLFLVNQLVNQQHFIYIITTKEVENFEFYNQLNKNSQIQFDYITEITCFYDNKIQKIINIFNSSFISKIKKYSCFVEMCIMDDIPYRTLLGNYFYFLNNIPCLMISSLNFKTINNCKKFIIKNILNYHYNTISPNISICYLTNLQKQQIKLPDGYKFPEIDLVDTNIFNISGEKKDYIVAIEKDKIQKKLNKNFQYYILYPIGKLEYSFLDHLIKLIIPTNDNDLLYNEDNNSNICLICLYQDTNINLDSKIWPSNIIFFKKDKLSSNEIKNLYLISDYTIKNQHYEITSNDITLGFLYNIPTIINYNQIDYDFLINNINCIYINFDQDVKTQHQRLKFALSRRKRIKNIPNLKNSYLESNNNFYQLLLNDIINPSIEKTVRNKINYGIINIFYYCLYWFIIFNFSWIIWFIKYFYNCQIELL